jgi:hypothetical protein
MRVFIDFMSYEQTPYDVQQDTTISGLKQLIQHHDGMPVANFELFFKHQKLENAMSLRHYNIHDGAHLDIEGNLNPTLHPRVVNGVHGGGGFSKKKADITTLLRQMRQLCA